jgi:hypothetical protein
MLKTLVSLETNLASRLALKYACNLAKIIDMELYTFYVREPDSGGPPPGSGWVQKTWQDALVQSDQDEIVRLIKTQKASYPKLGPLKISLGEREKEIYYELQSGFFGLFIEGALHTFDVSPFSRRIHSWFYQNSPCPIILVKNLVDLQRVLIVLSQGVNYSKLTSTFLKIFKGLAVELDLVYYHFNDDETSMQHSGEDADMMLQNTEKILMKHEMTASHCRVIQDSTEKRDEFMQGYGLIVSSVYHQSNKNNPLLELLGRAPYPLFLCRQ